ncbi:MAG: SDR family oxidoreductase [Maribacter sp.]|nr:SDR family oxidoreductase [Maribacter sp.]
MAKTIFITGASSGLGKATAKLFSKKGWNVYATMRNPSNESELNSFDNITILPLDVTNVDEIKSTVQIAVSRNDIDVVFNNAGYGLSGPFEGTTDKQIVQQINTNLLGVMRVTKAFLPHFRGQNKGLFITTTSIGGLVSFPFFSIYHATKWALEGWSESLAFELSSFNISVKTLSPGGIKTDFIDRSLISTSHDAYIDQTKKVMSVFMDPELQKGYSTAEQISEVVFEAATDGKQKLRYVAGEDAIALYKQRLTIGDEDFRNEIKQLFMEDK